MQAAAACPPPRERRDDHADGTPDSPVGGRAALAVARRGRREMTAAFFASAVMRSPDGAAGRQRRRIWPAPRPPTPPGRRGEDVQDTQVALKELTQPAPLSLQSSPRSELDSQVDGSFDFMDQSFNEALLNEEAILGVPLSLGHSKEFLNFRPTK